MALRIPSAAMKTNQALNGKRILKNMSAVSGAMMLGDAVCQGLETFDTDTELAWDHARTIRMGITGAFVTTPASFTWNLYAERIAPGTSLRAVMTKLAVSIAVFPPMLASQFTSLTLLEKGKNADDVRRKLSRDFMPTFKNGLVFWPVISVANSVFVPVLSRPIFSSFAGVFWNVYISYQANHNGMDVGEVSVVYSEGREGTLAAAGAETTTSEETDINATDAAAPAPAPAVAAVATPADAVVVSDATAGAGATTAAAAAVSSAKDAAVVVVREGRPEVAGTAAAAVDAAGIRKRREKFVRRTSVVSM